MINDKTTNDEPVEWAGTKGGTKQHLLRVHRDEVVDYLNKNGAIKTMLKYGMMSTTLDNLVKRDGDKKAVAHLKDVDRAITLAKIAREDARDTKREVYQLKRDYQEFSSQVSERVGGLIAAPLKALIDRAMTLPEGEPKRLAIVKVATQAQARVPAQAKRRNNG